MPIFRRKSGKGKPLIKAAAKKKNQQGWRFVKKLGQISFAQSVIRKVTEAVTQFIKPKAEKLKEEIAEEMIKIPVRDLPVRDIERDDVVDGLTVEVAGNRIAIGVNEDERGTQSGENLGELLEAMERLGKVKELTPKARSHFADRGIYIPEGAKYLVLTPSPTMTPAFEEFRRELGSQADKIMAAAAIAYRGELKKA